MAPQRACFGLPNARYRRTRLYRAEWQRSFDKPMMPQQPMSTRTPVATKGKQTFCVV
jgi:hypothetical protein